MHEALPANHSAPAFDAEAFRGPVEHLPARLQVRACACDYVRVRVNVCVCVCVNVRACVTMRVCALTYRVLAAGRHGNCGMPPWS